MLPRALCWAMAAILGVAGCGGDDAKDCDATAGTTIYIAGYLVDGANAGLDGDSSAGDAVADTNQPDPVDALATDATTDATMDDAQPDAVVAPPTKLAKSPEDLTYGPLQPGPTPIDDAIAAMTEAVGDRGRQDASGPDADRRWDHGQLWDIRRAAAAERRGQVAGLGAARDHRRGREGQRRDLES